MTTAANLPDDVVEAARAAIYEADKHAFGNALKAMQRGTTSRVLAALLDAGIVALVPDPDTDAVEALDAALTTDSEQDYTDKVWGNLNAAGWTVVRTVDVCPDPSRHEATTGVDPDVQRPEPCWTCHGRAGWFDCAPFSTKPLWIDCPACGSGERPAGHTLERPTHTGDVDEGGTDALDATEGDPANDEPSIWHEPDTGMHGDPPPAGDLPGDGWVRYRTRSDGLWLMATDGEWWNVSSVSDFADLHPDPSPEPEPRPTDGWQITVAHEPEWGCWVWCLGTSDHLVDLREQGVAGTHEEAVQAAEQARTAWDARLGGAA